MNHQVGQVATRVGTTPANFSPAVFAMIRLQRINSNNLNQYAKKANETGSIYRGDIEILKAEQEKIWELLKEIYKKLAQL